MPHSTPLFCSNCGSSLTPGSAFCDECGQPVQQPSPVVETVAKLPVEPPLTQVVPPQASSVTTPPPAAAPRKHLSLILFVVVLVACIIGVAGGLLYERYKSSLSADNLPASDQSTILSDPAGAFDANPTPPVEVAYVHFLDEAHQRSRGSIRVGSPTMTPTRIEVRVTAANAKPETLVVLQQSNDGRQATVIVGPKDAGAVRSYTLVRGPSGWTIQSIQELDG